MIPQPVLATRGRSSTPRPLGRGSALESGLAQGAAKEQPPMFRIDI